MRKNRVLAILMAVIVCFGALSFPAGTNVVLAEETPVEQTGTENQDTTETAPESFSAKSFRLSSMPDGGVISYSYQEPPTAATSIYVGYKNEKGVLIQLEEYNTEMIQSMYDQGNQNVTYRYVLPNAPEGAVSGMTFFWGGSRMKPLEIESTVTPLSRDSVTETVSFPLEQFLGYSVASTVGMVKYMESKDSDVEVTTTIQADATIIYNGVPLAINNTNDSTEDDSLQMLANYFGNTIRVGNNLSGKVTLRDTDNDPAYDVVEMEAPVTAVVKEVTSGGIVKFYRNVQAWNTGNTIKLVFDENDPDTIINLTKNGKSISHTELKKWDVVSITWDGVGGIYNVEVLDEGNYVDGAISVAKANGDVVLSDGNTYEISTNVYGISYVEPGLAGRFYIDDYGKIVALNEDVFVEGLSPALEYAYVLNAQVVDGIWDDEIFVRVRLLNQDGEICDVQMADKVQLMNFDQTLPNVIGSAGMGGNGAVKKSFVATLNEVTSIPDLDAFADVLINRMIAYEGNDAGEITTLMVEAYRNSERDMALIASGTAEYNKEALMFKNGIAVNEDTKVFFIAPGIQGGGVTYGNASVVANAEQCFVGSIERLIHNQAYQVYGFDPNEEDEAQVIVLMNETGRLDSATNIAVIDQIGTTIVNGTDEVYVVSYYQDGELKTATTKPDMPTAMVIAMANRGDILQMMVYDGVIEYAKSVLSFNQTWSGELYAMDATSTPVFTLGVNGLDESYLFGAVTKITSGGTAMVQPLRGDGAISSTDDLQYVREDDANVYVYDINEPAESRLTVGKLGDANVDKALTNVEENVTLKDGTVIPTPAYGMMDYVFVRNYNTKPADIVVYKNYIFDKEPSSTPDIPEEPGESELPTVSQYGYILDATTVDSAWGNEKDVYLRLLTMSGEVKTARLTSKVTLANFDQTLSGVVGSAGLDSNGAIKKSFVATLNEVTSITDLDAFANGLINRMIAYEGNDAGEIATLMVEAIRSSERDMALIASGNASYNKDAMMFKNGILVNENTKVFQIAPGVNGYISYGDCANTAIIEDCSVTSIDRLIDNQTYQVYGFAPDANDEAQVVVLMNETGRLDPAANVAVIDQIGTTVVDGNNAVYSVTYYQDGELKTATTKPDMSTEMVIAAAKKGDIVQMMVYDGVIEYAKPVLSFNSTWSGELYAMDATATPVFTLGAAGLDESYIFGAVTKFTNNGTAMVQPLQGDGTISSTDDLQYVREGDANVYVYDINLKQEYRLSVGSLGDAVVDDLLTESGWTVYDNNYNVLTVTPAYGMMDYVFVRNYNNKPADIVVYKNYDFYQYYGYFVQ